MEGVVTPLAGAGAPSAAATATPATLAVPGSVVTLSAAASTGSGTLTYAWVLHGPNGVATSLLSSSTNVAPTFTPNLYGAWGATVTVTDSVGNATATAYLQVAATNGATAQYLIFGALPVTRVARTEFVKSVFSIVT